MLTEERITQILRYTALGYALIFLGLYLYVVAMRIAYPYELEWEEGGMLGHVVRILSGKALYVEPSMEFVPFIYTPFYYYVCALFAKLFGVHFFSLRLVSFLSSLGCFSIIFLFVYRETSDLISAFIAMGLFAATYHLSGSWLDIARVDSLFLFFILIASYLVRFNSSVLSGILAAFFAVLACLTKQTAIYVALLLIVVSAILHGKKALIYSGTFLVLICLSIAVLNAMHQGWFLYYIFYLPRSHDSQPGMSFDFLVTHLILALPISLLVGTSALVLSYFKKEKKAAIANSVIAVSMITGSWFSCLHSGSYANVYLLSDIGVSLVFGIGFHEIKALSTSISKSYGTRIALAVSILTLVQFCLLHYNPKAAIPTSSDKQAGDLLVKTISEIQGDVLIPRHGYLAWLVDKKSFAHEMAISDILRSDDAKRGQRIKHELFYAIQNKQFAAVIVDYAWLRTELNTYYRVQRKVFPQKEFFWPMTGLRTRPEKIYVPRETNE